MKVFIVMEGDYEEIQVDSVWSTEDLAQKRCNYLGRDYSDISSVEIDDPGIDISDFAAWRAHLYLPTGEIGVSQLEIPNKLEFDKLTFNNVSIICVRWGVTPPKIVNSTKI